MSIGAIMSAARPKRFGGALWTPAALSPTRWGEVRTLELAADAPIASYTDLSGNGNHATQGTEANRPLYKENIANGHAGALFDGSNDEFVLTGLNLGNDATYFFVIKTGTTTIGIFDSAPSTADTFRNKTDGTWEIHDGNPTLNLNCADNTLFIIAFKTTVTPAREILYYKDGALSATGSGSGTTSIAFANPHMGSINSTSFYNGHILADFMVNSILSTANMNLLGDYFATVFGELGRGYE